MFPLNSISISNPSATPFVSYINEKFLEQFEPNLFFARFSEAPVSQVGYNSVTWVKAQRSEVTVDQAKMTAGITPVDSAQKLDTITVAAKQYGMYTIISDELSLIAKNLALMSQVAELISNNMARIVDRVVQDEVLDNAVNRLFAATTSGWVRAANRAALTASHKMFALDFVRLNTLLQEKYVPYREGNSYIAIAHPRVTDGLKTETTVGAFIDVRKYSQPEDIIKGEIGKMNSVRIVESPFVKVVSNGSINVYQTVVFGKGAYGMAKLDDMKSIIKPFGSGGTEDPLDQRMTIGAKTFFAAKILQQDAIIVFESAGAF